MARLSISQFSLNLEKSWINAVWITPSEARAPAMRLSVVGEFAPMRFGAHPLQGFGRPLRCAPFPSTSCPAFSNSGTIAVPTKPVAPVKKTRMM